jgi:ParB family transcriptional regulator, chromosome partitioning protein
MSANEKPVGNGVQSIALDQIEVVDRLRDIDQQAVSNLAASMGGKNGEETNIIQPIVVHSKSFGVYRLAAGAHRLEAARKLGWKEISAIVVSGLKDDEVRILEIDENLHRRELSPGEYAEFATMKIRLALRAADKRQQMPKVSKLDGDLADEYVKVAGIAGVHPETIALAVRRRRELDHVWDRLKGTSAMNSGAALDRLRKKFDGRVEEVVDAAISDHDGNIEAAMNAAGEAKANKKTSISAEDALKALRKAWKACPAAKKQKFLDENKDEVIGILKSSAHI